MSKDKWILKKLFHLSSDAENTLGLGVDTTVGVLVGAVTLAYGHLNLVGTSGPGLLLAGLGGDLPGNVVRAGSLSLSELRVTKRHVLRRLDENAQETRTGGLNDLVDDSHGEFGSSRARSRGDDGLGDVNNSTVDFSAHIENLANVNWVGILIVDDIDERLNSNVIANKVADDRLDLVGELLANSATAANDTTVQDDLEKLVDGVVHEANASGAQVQSGRLNGLLENRNGTDL